MPVLACAHTRTHNQRAADSCMGVASREVHPRPGSAHGDLRMLEGKVKITAGRMPAQWQRATVCINRGEGHLGGMTGVLRRC